MHLLYSRGIRALISLLYMSLLARTLGPDDLGEWTMVMGAATLLHSLLLNWMHPATVRFGREEWSRTGSLAATWASRWPFLLLGFSCVGVFLLLIPFQWLPRLFHLNNEMTLVVFISMLGLWLSSEAQNMLQARGEFPRLGYLTVSAGLVSITILLLLMLDFIAVTSLYAIIITVQGLNALFWSGVLLRIWRGSSFHWQRPAPEHLQRNLLYAWPLIPGFLLGFISDWGDQLIIRYFLSSSEVGLFQSAYQLMLLFLGISSVISSILLPRLIDKSYISSDGAREFMVTSGPTIIALGLFPLILVITVVPYLFSLLMGAQFLDATNVFVILCMVIPSSLLSSFYGVFFNIQGRFWHSTVLLGGTKIVINIALSLLLVPVIGIMGSAVATVISYGALQYLYFRNQHRYYQVSHTKVSALFGIMVTFSLAQAIVGTAYLPRTVVCCVGLALLTLIVRKYCILDKNCVMTLCSGRLTGLGRLILRVAVSRESVQSSPGT